MPRINHFHICTQLDSSPDVARRTVTSGKMDPFTEMKLLDFMDAIKTFPSLKPVALQIHFQEKPLIGKEDTYQLHSENHLSYEILERSTDPSGGISRTVYWRDGSKYHHYGTRKITAKTTASR
jgi:hypothetical protein